MGEMEVRLPDVGEGIADAEVVEWLVEVGQEVRDGDPVLSVMTDKATVELPSPASGILQWVAGEVGAIVAVGAPLFRLTVAGDGPVETPTAPAAAAPQIPASKIPEPKIPAPQTPPARRHAGADPFAVGTSAPRRHDGGRSLASPTVRRRATDLGIALSELTGTGPLGRIRHEDLDRHLVEREGLVGSDGTDAAAGSRERSTGDVERTPLSGLRRSIARRMALSSARIPHFTYVEEVDVTELLRTRAALGQEWGTDDADSGPGVLPFLMRAITVAVRDHPEMNAHLVQDADGDLDTAVVERHAAVHLGVAVQTDDGLMVVVVRDAHRLDVRGCAGELERLAASARSGSAALDELRGSTITLSSLGAIGGVAATPIINHPEVAIVGVNKIVERPVVRDGVVVVRSCMNLSASFDHRVVDGWDGARFVQRIRVLLETPALLFA